MKVPTVTACDPNKSYTPEISLRQVHVVAAVNSVCLGAATTLTQTLGSICEAAFIHPRYR